MENQINTNTILGNISQKRSYIPVSYSLVIFAFFLTFFEIKCSGREVMSLKGTDIVFGKNYNSMSNDKLPSINDEATYHDTKEVISNSYMFALGAVGFAIIGLIIYFVKIKEDYIIWIMISIFGVFSLVILYLGFENSINARLSGKEISPLIEVSPGIGFYLAFLGFFFSGLLSYNIYRYNNKDD